MNQNKLIMTTTENTHKSINPFLDWSFKYIFGREENKDILLGFLNVLLNPDHPIQDITYLNPETIPDTEDNKRCVVDVLCTDAAGDRFLVEMQHSQVGNIRNRIIYYVCRLINEMGRRSDDWQYDIQRVYAICITDFNYAKDPVLRNDIMLMDKKSCEQFSDRLFITTLQIPCIKVKSLKECREDYEKLLTLLKLLRDNDMTFKEVCAEIAASGASPEMKAAMERIVKTADYASLSEKDRALYDAALKQYRDYQSSLTYAEEKGFEKGVQQGVLKVAQSMKALGMPVETIVEVTGLTQEQVSKLNVSD